MKIGHLLLSATLLLTGCASTPNWDLEYLVIDKSVDFRSGKLPWKLLKYDNFKNGGFARYYIPNRENELKSWSELITGVFISDDKVTLKKYLMTNEKQMKVRCPGTMHHVIESDMYNAYYTNTYPACGGRERQSEITRIIKGNDGIHRLSYTVKGRELTSGEKEKWLNSLRKCYIAKGEKHEKVR